MKHNATTNKVFFNYYNRTIHKPMRIVTTDLARQIALDFNLSIQQRVDALLKADCSNYTNLGIDSTESERSLVRGTSKDIYQLVNLIDEETGNLLLKSIDS
tara:strand:+ start:493 stop:795 length:303 start_codon:yes stop_codon:yes gene_type:complete